MSRPAVKPAIYTRSREQELEREERLRLAHSKPLFIAHRTPQTYAAPAATSAPTQTSVPSLAKSASAYDYSEFGSDDSDEDDDWTSEDERRMEEEDRLLQIRVVGALAKADAIEKLEIPSNAKLRGSWAQPGLSFLDPAQPGPSSPEPALSITAPSAPSPSVHSPPSTPSPSAPPHNALAPPTPPLPEPTLPSPALPIPASMAPTYAQFNWMNGNKGRAFTLKDAFEKVGRMGHKRINRNQRPMSPPSSSPPPSDHASSTNGSVPSRGSHSSSPSLERKVTQYEKDQQRINQILKSETALFVKTEYPAITHPRDVPLPSVEDDWPEHSKMFDPEQEFTAMSQAATSPELRLPKLRNCESEEDSVKRTSDIDPEERIAGEASLFELRAHSEKSTTGSDIESFSREPSPDRKRPLMNTAILTSVEEDMRLIRAEAGVDDSTVEEVIDTIDSPTEKNENGEMDTYQRMDQALRRGLNGIQSIKRGIVRLEEKVSSVPEPPVDNSFTYHVSIKLPRLWTTDPTHLWGVRLTWLGLALLSLSTWYLTESAVCYQFCHPEYSFTNDFNVSDPFFPYALPTKLDQWSGGVVSTALRWIGGWLMS